MIRTDSHQPMLGSGWTRGEADVGKLGKKEARGMHRQSTGKARRPCQLVKLVNSACSIALIE